MSVGGRVCGCDSTRNRKVVDPSEINDEKRVGSVTGLHRNLHPRL